MTSPRGACEPATGPWARIVPVELVPAAAVEGVETSQESPTADSAEFAWARVIPTTLGTATKTRIARLLFNCGPTPFKVMRVVEVGTDLVVVVVVVVGKPPASEGLPRPPTPKSATNPRISTAAAIPSRLRDLRTIHILSPHRPATKTAKWHATSTRPPSPGPASRPRTSTLEPARSHGGDDERSRRGEGRVLPRPLREGQHSTHGSEKAALLRNRSPDRRSVKRVEGPPSEEPRRSSRGHLAAIGIRGRTITGD